MSLFGTRKIEMINPERALPGRPEAIVHPTEHVVLHHPLVPPFPDGLESAIFALGCFWGAERKFWNADGVFTTAAGYSGGYTPNPTYEEVCSGRTGHAEAVLVVFDPQLVAYADLVGLFYESHDPTQAMRQGNDIGTQYRSALYTATPEQAATAAAVTKRYREVLEAAGFGAIATEIADAGPFYYAEDYHQQYLAKNPGGYCGLGGTGVSCPRGVLGS